MKRTVPEAWLALHPLMNSMSNKSDVNRLRADLLDRTGNRDIVVTMLTSSVSLPVAAILQAI
jgi:hypothetical protein